MRERIKKYVPALADTLLSVVTLLGCFLILEYSTADVITKILDYIMSFSGEVLLLNVLTLGIALVFLLMLTNRVWLSCLLLSCFCGILGVINYYVIQLHGMPMCQSRDADSRKNRSAHGHHRCNGKGRAVAV